MEIPTALADFVTTTVSSTIEAHSLQSGQRPTHFGDSYPQDWQTFLFVSWPLE